METRRGNFTLSLRLHSTTRNYGHVIALNARHRPNTVMDMHCKSARANASNKLTEVADSEVVEYRAKKEMREERRGTFAGKSEV